MPTLIVGGRNSGKTTKCIRLAAEHNAYIVCRTHQEASRIAAYATKLDLHIPFPLSYDEFIQGQFCGKGINGFVIDNVDDLVSYLSRGVEIVAMSIYGGIPCNTVRPAAWESPETKSDV